MTKVYIFTLFSILIIFSNQKLVSAQDQTGDGNLTKLEIGSMRNYAIKITSDGFAPVSLTFCNHSLEPEEARCLAPRGSKFTIIKLDQRRNEAYVRFVSVNQKSQEGNPNKYVAEGILYKHDLEKLELYGEKERSFESKLKLVLIPQKIYFHEYEHSANPTLGIAYSVMPNVGVDAVKVVAAVEYGIGFNQISVETADSVEDRVGLSIFMGYSFVGNDGLKAGIYYGIDYVNLKGNDLFIGSNKNNRDWLGLVISTTLN